MNIRHKIGVVLACLLAPAAPAQFAPSNVDAATNTVRVLDAQALAAREAFKAYRDVRCVIVTLETDADANAKPARMEIASDSARRFVQRVLAKDDSGGWDEGKAYFSHFDGTKFRARRGTLDMYIEHDASMAWSNPPAFAALAPWAVLQALEGVMTTRRVGDDTLVTIGSSTTLSFAADGSLRSWKGGRANDATVEYADFRASGDGGSPAMPATIIERKASEDGSRDVTWRVASIALNPPAAELEAALAFERVGANLKRFDPDTGDITNPDGSSGGREIQPAAKAVEMWEAKTKTGAWEAVFKWGGIATGLFLLAGVMELIRRRL
jgi:hypothetical protein